MDERWRLYIGYGLKMAPFYMVRIKDGASILGMDLRWHLCIWLESGMDIDKFFYFNIADTVHRKGNMYTVKK